MESNDLIKQISFESMTIEMLPSILIIENQAYPIPWSVQSFKDSISKDYFCQVMLLDEKIIGYFIIQIILDEFQILNICISPDYQGKGLGKLQLLEIVKLAETKLMNRISLEVRASNKVAKNLYQNSGFHQIGKRKNYYPTESGKEDAYVLELALG